MTQWPSRAGCLAFALVLVGGALLPARDEAPKRTAGKAETKPPAPSPDGAKSKKPTPKNEGSAKSGTYRVKREPFKIEVALKGVFEAERMTPLSLRPQAWTPDNRGMMVVDKALEQGASVKKGEQLVWLDLEKIDRAIRDLDTDLHLADLAIREAEQELPILERAAPLELASAERSKQFADEDLKRFAEFDRPLAERIVQFRVRQAGNELQYSREELRQLEKMYRANDIREETEEIILKRQRDDVQNHEFALSVRQSQQHEALSVTLPREEQELRQNALKEAIVLDKAKALVPLQLRQKQLALDKMRYERAKAGERLGHLQQDRQAMVVRAPADGIVYYGRCHHGHWVTAGAMAGKLQPGGMLMPDEIFMTLVERRPIFVRAAVEEKELRDVHAGLGARIVPAFDPQTKLSGKVAEVTTVPGTSGNFEARVQLDAGKDLAALMPGMDAAVKLVAYLKQDALTVPSRAVFAEDLDEDAHYVYLKPTEGKPEKRSVTVGRSSEGKTEITAGLRENDEILLEKPKDEDSGK